MDIEIQRAAKTLDKGNRTGLGRLSGKLRFLDQVGRDAAVNTAKDIVKTVCYRQYP